MLLIKIALRRLEWAIHNIVGHPLMEVCFLLGLERLGIWIHEESLPEEDEDFIPVCNQYAIDRELAKIIEDQIKESEEESDD